MHILDEEFRKELIDRYIGEITTVFNRPEDIFFSVIDYLGETIKNIDEVRKLIDALADWTHNPTENGLRKILDIEEMVSGYGLTSNADEAIAVISYCISHGISISISVVGKCYKIGFKDITISQCNEIEQLKGMMNGKQGQGSRE